MRRALALALLALLPMAPALVPGAMAYMDNPAHLVNVRDIQDILAEEAWFSGWHARANAGMAVNQVNAPLVWLAVAVLGSLFGTTAVYVAGMLASNVVFAWGAHRFLLRWLAPDAAWFGAALAAIAATDLYGYAGAVGGMWPHRLANGILLAGLGTAGPASPGKIGAWLAAVLLCHTYAGMDAAAIVGIAILLDAAGGRWRDFGRRVAGALIGALLSAPFWVPLLDGELRPTLPGSLRFFNVLDHLALVLLPFSPERINDPRNYELLGGPLNLGWTLALLAGLAGAWGHRAELRDRLRPLLRPPALAGPLFLALLVLVVVVVVPITLTDAFGPNPWRHLALVRVVVCGLAGAGLAALGYGVRSSLGALLFALGAVGGWAGAREIHAPVDAETKALHASLEATWDDVVAAGVTGRVYHQNTSLTVGGPPELYYSHAGALLAYRSELSVLGTWYAISAVASEPDSRSSRGAMLGRSPEKLYRRALDFHARARAYGIGAFVAIEPELAAFLDTQSIARRISSHPPFGAWVMTYDGLGPFDCREPMTCGAAREGRGWAETTVRSDGADGTVTLRQSWHPWWTATLDGAPVEVSAAQGTTLVAVELPAFEGEKTLVLRWVDPTRWTRWVALVGLLAAIVAWRGRSGAREERAAA